MNEYIRHYLCVAPVLGDRAAHFGRGRRGYARGGHRTVRLARRRADFPKALRRGSFY